MKARVVRAVLSVIAIVAVAGVSYTVGAMQGAKAVNMPFTSLKWEPAGPGSPLTVAPLWGGDRTKSRDHGFLLKIPAGFEAGGHTHTADYHAVAIQGGMDPYERRNQERTRVSGGVVRVPAREAGAQRHLQGAGGMHRARSPARPQRFHRGQNAVGSPVSTSASHCHGYR
jgi:hypothetical protein